MLDQVREREVVRGAKSGSLQEIKAFDLQWHSNTLWTKPNEEKQLMVQFQYYKAWEKIKLKQIETKLITGMGHTFDSSPSIYTIIQTK